MLLQEFFANVVQKPCSKFVISGNNKNMNHNDLENNNATITRQKSFLREGKFNVLNDLICCKGRSKLTKYRKKNVLAPNLLKIQQQKWRLANKTQLQSRYS